MCLPGSPAACAGAWGPGAQPRRRPLEKIAPFVRAPRRAQARQPPAAPAGPSARPTRRAGAPARRPARRPAQPSWAPAARRRRPPPPAQPAARGGTTRRLGAGAAGRCPAESRNRTMFCRPESSTEPVGHRVPSPPCSLHSHGSWRSSHAAATENINTDLHFIHTSRTLVCCKCEHASSRTCTPARARR